MVDRPFADKRPFGPIVDINKVKRRLQNMASGGKTVVGVSGTPFPNRPKHNMVLVYVIDGDHIPIIRDLNSDIRRKVTSRDEYSDFRVDIKRSGTSAKATFEQQAIIIRVPGGDLPINDEDIHRIEQIINRAIPVDAKVAQIIIEQE